MKIVFSNSYLIKKSYLNLRDKFLILWYTGTRDFFKNNILSLKFIAIFGVRR